MTLNYTTSCRTAILIWGLQTQPRRKCMKVLASRANTSYDREIPLTLHLQNQELSGTILNHGYTDGFMYLRQPPRLPTRYEQPASFNNNRPCFYYPCNRLTFGATCTVSLQSLPRRIHGQGSMVQ